MEDQVQKASNDYLRFLMAKMNPEDHEERMFDRFLEKQIEANNIKLHGERKQRKK